MAKLAEVLRGYTPPTESALADPIKQHFANLPQTTAQNIAKQRQDIDAALQMTPQGIQVGDQQAYNRIMNEVPNIAGMMIGPQSALWNETNAFKAAKMLKQDIPAAEVFKQTNTAKGLEGQFRQELSDANSFIKGGPTFYDTVMNRMKALEKPIGEPMYAKDVFHHPDIYKSYPQLGDIEIEFIAKGNKATASYNPLNNVIKLNEKLTPKEARSSMLHEMQHAIQEIEGFNKGADANKIIGASVKHYDDLMGEIGDLNSQMSKAVGTPEYDYLMNRRANLTKKVQALGDPLVEGSKIYKNYGGEAEARLTQLRRDLFPEKAKQFYPFDNKAGNIYGLDINPSEAIIDTASVLEPINRRQMLEQLLKTQK
tara:strand:+ start:2746 stop:3852 length:1107 start_codon:yes stop_codon:yes gene_type:complete